MAIELGTIEDVTTKLVESFRNKHGESSEKCPYCPTGIIRAQISASASACIIECDECTYKRNVILT